MERTTEQQLEDLQNRVHYLEQLVNVLLWKNGITIEAHTDDPDGMFIPYDEIEAGINKLPKKPESK